MFLFRRSQTSDYWHDFFVFVFGKLFPKMPCFFSQFSRIFLAILHKSIEKRAFLG